MRFGWLGLLLLLSMRANALQVAGVDVADSVKVGADQVLVLNGAGIRDKFFLDIYVAELYLSSKAQDADKVLSMPAPKRIVMHFLYKEVDREKLVDGWNEGFELNLSKTALQAIKPRLEQFNGFFKTVHAGDRIILDQLADGATQVSLNDDVLGRIEGADFYRALLQIWIGKEPISTDLKEALLGLE